MVDLDPCWPTAREQIEILLEGGGGGGGGPLTIADTQSVDMNGAGTSGSPLSANVKISTQPSNGLSILADGLFALQGSGGGSVTQEQVQDWIGAGIAAVRGLSYDDPANTYSVALANNGGLEHSANGLRARISVDADNVMELRANGLYATLRQIDTRANLLAKEAAGTLTAGRFYLVSTTKTIATIPGVLLIIFAAANNRVGSQGFMIHPNFPGTAWPMIYSFSTDEFVEVKDHRGNIIQGNDNILNFPFHITTYTNVRVRGMTDFAWSNDATLDNVLFDNASTVALTGFEGEIANSYFGMNSTVAMSGGGGGGGPGPGPGPGTPGLHVSGVNIVDSNGQRFVFAGMNIEMYRDYNNGCGYATDGFWDARSVMAQKIHDLGVNAVRMNYSRATLEVTGRLSKFLDVCVEFASRGIYVMVSDHTYTGGSLSSASGSHAMMKSIYDGMIARGYGDYLIINPWNEPGPSVTNSQLITACQNALTYLRGTANFDGIVVFDGSGWATLLDVPTFNSIKTFDASLRGGTPNVAFSHHLYPNITSLPSQIWANSNQIPLLIGELGQENPGASGLVPSYVTGVIGGFYSTGRANGHNGLFAWIANWCDTNKLYEDWTNPAVAYDVNSPLSAHGILWRDNYFTNFTLSAPSEGGGSSSASTGTYTNVTVVDSTLSATGFEGVLRNARILNGSTLDLEDAAGEWFDLLVDSGSTLDLGTTRRDGNNIIATGQSQVIITGKTAGDIYQITALRGSTLEAAAAAGNIGPLLLEQSTVSLNNSTVNVSGEARGGSTVSLTSASGTVNLFVTSSSQLNAVGATGLSVTDNEISLSSIVTLDNSDNTRFRWNKIVDSNVDLSGANDLICEHNTVQNGTLLASGGSVERNFVGSGSTLRGGRLAGTEQIISCVIENNGYIGVEWSTEGVVSNCRASGGSINANSDQNAGVVDACDVSSGGTLFVGNATHSGLVAYVSVRAGRYVEAACNGPYEHRYGIHAGPGTYTYATNLSVTGIRDQD